MGFATRSWSSGPSLDFWMGSYGGGAVSDDCHSDEYLIMFDSELYSYRLLGFRRVGTLVPSSACMPLKLLLNVACLLFPPLLGMDHDGAFPPELLGDLTCLIHAKHNTCLNVW